jgi:hypothetical protein
MEKIAQLNEVEREFKKLVTDMRVSWQNFQHLKEKMSDLLKENGKMEHDKTKETDKNKRKATMLSERDWVCEGAFWEKKKGEPSKCVGCVRCNTHKRKKFNGEIHDVCHSHELLFEAYKKKLKKSEKK